MLEKKRVSFRPMNEDDLVLMLKWLTDDRVLEFYDGRDKKHTQKTIREHYTEQWADEIYRVIIEYDTIPIGYAQIYRIQGELFDEYNYHETEEKIYAMDQFIGEPEYWNMGIGAEYCRVVCQYLRTEMDADAVILDPRKNNLRAVRAYEKLSAERQQIAEQIARLEQLLVAYSEYEPYIVYHKTSNSLKGFAKRKYDKEHETELREYDSYRAKLKKMLSSDEKITPKKWTAEKTKLEERLQESNPDYARVVTELASTEVIEHNRKMLAMTREAEQNQRSQIHSRKKNEQSL